MTYQRGDRGYYVPTKRNKKGLDPRTTVERILSGLKVRDEPERVFRCHVCRDVGWVELEAGVKATMQSGATVTVPEGGPGTFRRCDGGQSPMCRWRLFELQRAAEQVARDGKPASGEGASL